MGRRMKARKTIRGSKAKVRSRSASQRSRPNRVGTGTEQRIQRYGQIVNHFEQIARANVGKFVHVADVSRVAGVNQRTLSRAFREIHGIGPYRYLQHLRLSELKRVLFSEEITVTQAALRLGFGELGKLGVLYKKTFGESPSDTRRRRQAVLSSTCPH
jgi:transcriptional regulator GlxA family with amidase domain